MVRSTLIVVSATWLTGVGTPPMEISRFTVDAGGAVFSRGDGFVLGATIGQADTGRLASDVYVLTGGFWFEVPPGDCTDDGTVGLPDYAISHARQCLAGPATAVLPPDCACFDLDRNGVIDLRDVALTQQLHTGY